ncbi:MAG TPA: phosphatase PAP2 family protein [Intrasporangium sp.]|uniref:phosphatase PAP2 family protein n=1 Tax=Intrasporangium sp. TaxID=1925024 RepID=UPI002F931BC6
MAATGTSQKAGWLSEVRAQAVAVDSAISEAVEKTETPALDRFLVLLSDAANGSRLWIATAGAVALVGGQRGRRAATEAVASIALASAVSNLALKSMSRRRRPQAGKGQVVPSRQVRRPMSSSFPSGHAASAFAFASTMGEMLPVTWVPTHLAASLVAYARVHTGVHYPSDVVAGALAGAMCGSVVRRLARRLSPRTQRAGESHVVAR